MTPIAEVRARDSMKSVLARDSGITLVNVPFWWDRSVDRYLSSTWLFLTLSYSLVATIKQVRPDMFPNITANVGPIPSAIPDEIAARYSHEIKDIGEASTASFLTSTSVDPTSWYGVV